MRLSLSWQQSHKNTNQRLSDWHLFFQPIRNSESWSLSTSLSVLCTGGKKQWPQLKSTARSFLISSLYLVYLLFFFYFWLNTVILLPLCNIKFAEHRQDRWPLCYFCSARQESGRTCSYKESHNNTDNITTLVLLILANFIFVGGVPSKQNWFHRFPWYYSPKLKMYLNNSVYTANAIKNAYAWTDGYID